MDEYSHPDFYVEGTYSSMSIYIPLFHLDIVTYLCPTPDTDLLAKGTSGAWRFI